MAEIIPPNPNIGSDFPAKVGITVTPSDSTNLVGTRGIYVGGTGDVAVRFVGQPTETITFLTVPAGTLLPICLTRVMFATTATGIIALY